MTQNLGKTTKRPLRNFYLHQALDYKEKRENLMEKNNLEDLCVDGKYSMKTNFHEIRWVAMDCMWFRKQINYGLL